MILTRRRNVDMLHGPLLSRMLVFIVPVILTNLLQVFYNAADMVIAGLSSEPDAVGAIGTTGSFSSLMVNLFIGLSVGANVVIARHIGAGERERASRAVHTASVLAVLLGAVGGAIGFVIAPTVMRAMGNEGRLLELSVTYIRIYFVCMPAHALSNYAIAIYRAKGDTQTPLIVLTASGILNVLLNLFFVLVVGLSVEGVAIATGIAALASAIVLYTRLTRDDGPCRFSLRALCLDRAELSRILRIGLPSGLQNALFSISNMLIQSSIIALNNAAAPAGAAYAPVVKGNTAVNSIENFAFTAVNAATQATISFTSQNLGAKQYDRIKRVARTSFAINATFAVLMMALLYALHRPLLALYGVRAGDALGDIAMQTAITRIAVRFPTFVLYALMDATAGVMRGLGKASRSAIASFLGTCVFRVAWIYTVFRAIFTPAALYFSYPVSWLLTLLALGTMVLLEFRAFPKKAEVEVRV